MLVAFIIVLGFTGLNVLRVVRHLTPGQYRRDEEIHGWMNLGYLGHSYHVPPQILQQALGLPESPPDTRPLREIAKAQQRSVADLKGSLEEAITQFRLALNESLPPANEAKP
jgi:hypothetical protein